MKFESHELFQLHPRIAITFFVNGFTWSKSRSGIQSKRMSVTGLEELYQ